VKKSAKKASRVVTSSSPRRSTATAARSAAVPSRKKETAPVAAEVPLAQRALKKLKSKTGLAVLAGVALAVGGGLVRKYRKAS